MKIGQAFRQRDPTGTGSIFSPASPLGPSLLEGFIGAVRQALSIAMLGLVTACATTSGPTSHASEPTSESFFTRVPSDVVALTQSGIMGPDLRVPPSMALFSEPALRGGIAFLHKFRNRQGDVIGFGTQMEDVLLDQGGHYSGLHKTAFTIVIPGRGTLFLYETEDSRSLESLLRGAPAATTRMDWAGPAVTTTSGPGPGRVGIIIGGTGDFAGRRGTFVEIDKFTGVDPESPSRFIFEIEVRVNFSH